MLELSKDIGKGSDVARAYYYLGQSFSLQTQWDKAIENFHKGLEIAEKVNESNLLGEIHLAISSNYSKLGNLKKQLHHLKQGLKFSEEAGNRLLTMKITIDMGAYHIFEGNYSKAENTLDKALTESQNLHYEDYHFLRITHNLGMVHLLRGASKKDFEKAAGYFEKTLAVAEKNKYLMGEAYALNGGAEAYIKLGNIEKARKCLKQVEPKLTYLDNKNLQTGLKRLYGMLYAAEGDMDKAERSFNESIKMGREMKHLYFVGLVLTDYADFCKMRGKKAKQKAALEEALSIMKQLKNKGNIKKIEKKLAEV